MIKIYLVRHGETEWNRQGLLQGHNDSPLTEKGISQAQFLAQELEELTFDHIYSSDLKRAIDTAEIINKKKNTPLSTSKLLRERKFGKYEGKPHAVFQNELKPYTKQYQSLPPDKKKSFRYPGMESDEEVIDRLLTFISDIQAKHEDKSILLVTHSGIIRLILIHLNVISYENHFAYKIPQDEYFVLDLENDSLSINPYNISIHSQSTSL